MRQRHASRFAVAFALIALLTTAFLWSGCSDQNTDVTAPQSTLSVNFTDQFAKTIGAQKRHTDRLMAIDGVVGTGAGINANGSPVVKVFTKRANVRNIPSELDGVPVVVEETGEFTAFSLTGRYRPVPIGVSVGNNLECAAGTIGCVVFIGGQKYILSNNHVLARENLAAIGEDIVQPGRYDIQCANNVATDKVADLSDFEPLKFDGTNNYIDAAVALYSTTDMTCATLPTFYGYPSGTVANAAVGMAIKKVGRTTEQTVGTITAVNVTISVGYTRGTAKFVGQIMTSRKFCKSGDSGSLVITNDGTNRPVALLFGGTRTGEAILNPIGSVLTRFNATICNN